VTPRLLPRLLAPLLTRLPARVQDRLASWVIDVLYRAVIREMRKAEAQAQERSQ
jgi:hypothetical protein